MVGRTVWLVLSGISVAAAGGYWLGARDPESRVENGARIFSDPTGDPRSPPGGAAASPGESRAVADQRRARDADDAAPRVPNSDQRFADSRRLVEAALALPDGPARRDQLMSLGQAWARMAPEQAWEYASRLADPAARGVFQHAVVAAWAAGQPERAFGRVADLPAEWQRDDLLRLVTREIARRDPRLAIELLTTVEVVDRGSFHSLIVDEWARYDPSGAAEWIETQERRSQGRLAYQIAPAFVAQQPSEALAWALRISRSPGKNLWSHMLGLMAAENPYEALRLAQAAENPRQRNQALAAVLGTIALRDPALATSHFARLPPGQLRGETAGRIAAQIAETAPAAALDWVVSLDDQDARMQAAMQLGHTLASRDPDSAAELVDRVPDEVRAEWIASVAAAFAEYDPERGVQWVRGYQDEPEYPRILAQLTSNLAASSPEAALELVDRTLDGAERDDALVGMMHMVASQSPETAVRWLDRIADDAHRANATQRVVGIWARYDMAAARKWVLSMPSGSSRDGGILQLVANGPTSVEESLSLIGQIDSHEQRMNTVLSAAVRIGRTDPDGMRTLLRRYPLDPARQQQLDSMLKRQGRSRWWAN